MDYKKNLIDAYNKLDKAVEIHLANGGKVDDRQQLKEELAYRLRQLDAPPKEAFVGDVKIWSNGMWYNNKYHTVSDNHGYIHVVPKSMNMPTDHYYGALHLWIRDAFLQTSDLAVSHICGQKRTITHHINENKHDNNVANLIVIPRELHRIFHPNNTMMKTNVVGLQFCMTYGDATTTTNKPSDLVDARWLHNELGLSKEFSHWIEQWKDKVVFALQGEKVSTGGRPRKEYNLSVRDALKIAMVTDTTNAEVVRESLINKLQSANKLATVMANKPTLHSLHGDYPDLMKAIEKAFSVESAKNKALTAQLDAVFNLVGDGGYVSKRAIRNLKKELQNV
jgi:phage anti-repressor protein